MKQLKKFAGVLIIIVTLGFFVGYFAANPALWHELRTIPPLTFIATLLLYGVSVLVLIAILDATLRVNTMPIKWKENALLTAYSTIVNFFGPLQSGPGFRAVYLRQRHNISAKKFTLATLFYYGVLFFFSVIALLGGSELWMLSVVLLFVVAMSAWLLLPYIARRFSLRLDALVRLGVMTSVQVLLMSGIYFVELHGIDPTINYRQVLSYTGTANLSLFASLTPGAIGIREAFLLLTTNLHHIASTTVVAASVIDRTVYIVFLGLLFLGSLGVHAKAKLRLSSTEPTPRSDG